MPEGDTIHRAARALDRALGGRVLTKFEAPRLRFLPFPDGARVEGAEAVGKHCLVHFDDGRSLHTHLQMTGSWHLYRPGERWRKQRASMRALVAVDEWEAVCFAAPTVSLTDDPSVGHLGPDLCRDDADLDEAVRRMAELSAPDRPVGDALLDQRIAAGIGNIWRNETCFACGVDPSTPLSALDDAKRRRLLEVARDMLRRRIRGEQVATAVYGHADEPCRRCGTVIRWARIGEHRRGGYWCPTCQPSRRIGPPDPAGTAPG